MTGEKARNTLQPFLADLEVGQALTHLNLTLVPLRGEGHGQLDYILGADAIDSGTLVVTEVDESGSVSDLLVTSRADVMILLLDGEELIGAKQNRILNTTVLLPAKAKTTIPVSCVEQGRWHRTTHRFADGDYAPARLRARTTRSVGRSLRETGRAESDQHEVWQDIETRMEAFSVASKTMAMHDLIDQKRSALQEIIEALPFPQESRGVIAAINGRFVAMDLFDRAETLQRIWGRLLSGYAIDALAEPFEKDKTFGAEQVQRLLTRLGAIECQPCPAAALGQEWRFETEDLLGQALVFDERICVHLCAFPNDDHDGGGRHSGRISPPSRRRRR